MLLTVGCLSAQMAQYQFEYSSQEGRLWSEQLGLDTPLDVRVGARTSGSLTVRSPAEYYLALSFDHDGSQQRAVGLVSSRASPFQVRWSMTEDGHRVAGGEPGQWQGESFGGGTRERNLALVPLRPQRVYSLEVEIVGTAPELATANPRLQVVRDPHPYKGYYVSAGIAAYFGLLLRAAALLCFGLATTAWFWRPLCRLWVRLQAFVHGLPAPWRRA